jgi:hypothetical protein
MGYPTVFILFWHLRIAFDHTQRRPLLTQFQNLSLVISIMYKGKAASRILLVSVRSFLFIPRLD